MVKLEEVPDEDNDFTQPGPKIEDDNEWDTDGPSIPLPSPFPH